MTIGSDADTAKSCYGKVTSGALSECFVVKFR